MLNKDSATTLLLHELDKYTSYKSVHPSNECIVILDENGLNHIDEIKKITQKLAIEIYSNRYDVIEKALKNNITAHLNDFRILISHEKNEKIGLMAYRVSKEKPVTHHIINSFAKNMHTGSTLFISGKKNDGIKSYIENAKKNFDLKGDIKKHGDDYIAKLTPENKAISQDDNQKKLTIKKFLDDKNYTQIRNICSVNFNDKIYDIYSKPGVFGWNKIDNGSLFLTQVLTEKIEEKKIDIYINKETKSLDLGCGYGYLSLFAASLGIKDITATDNNATALLAIKKTAEMNRLKIDIIADDCAQSITKKFDFIFCNPPFHQGFDIDNTLTKKFIVNTHKLLEKNGAAYFVTNAFIGIEKLAHTYFNSVIQLANNKKFKIIKFANPK